MASLETLCETLCEMALGEMTEQCEYYSGVMFQLDPFVPQTPDEMTEPHDDQISSRQAKCSNRKKAFPKRVSDREVRRSEHEDRKLPDSKKRKVDMQTKRSQAVINDQCQQDAPLEDDMLWDQDWNEEIGGWDNYPCSYPRSPFQTLKYRSLRNPYQNFRSLRVPGLSYASVNANADQQLLMHHIQIARGTLRALAVIDSNVEHEYTSSDNELECRPTSEEWEYDPHF